MNPNAIAIKPVIWKKILINIIKTFTVPAEPIQAATALLHTFSQIWTTTMTINGFLKIHTNDRFCFMEK